MTITCVKFARNKIFKMIEAENIGVGNNLIGPGPKRKYKTEPETDVKLQRGQKKPRKLPQYKTKR